MTQAQCFSQRRYFGDENAIFFSIQEGSIQLWKGGGGQVAIMGAIIIDH
jgi:hypothetical protein